jgi:hypothetical protein
VLTAGTSLAPLIVAMNFSANAIVPAAHMAPIKISKVRAPSMEIKRKFLLANSEPLHPQDFI